MKIYSGMKEPGGRCDIMLTDTGTGGITRLGIQASLDLRSHSPSGFSWGYMGSGPSQTALAVLLHAVGKDLAIKHYMKFKTEFVQHWVDGFKIAEQKIIDWVKEQEGPGDIIDELNEKNPLKGK